MLPWLQKFHSYKISKMTIIPYLFLYLLPLQSNFATISPFFKSGLAVWLVLINYNRSKRLILSPALKRFCMFPLLYLKPCDYHVNKSRRIRKYMKHIQIIITEAILNQPAYSQSGSWPQMCEWAQSKPRELPSSARQRCHTIKLWLSKWKF